MSQQISWEKLVAQDRAKAMGIPWTEEEERAIREDGISPDDVRNGILDKKEAKKEEKKDDEEKPYYHWKKDRLIEKAKEIGIEFDEEVVTRGDLIVELKQHLKVEEE
ncbi:MAG: hypothetical protein ACOCTT_03790 [archaeon]